MFRADSNAPPLCMPVKATNLEEFNMTQVSKCLAHCWRTSVIHRARLCIGPNTHSMPLLAKTTYIIRQKDPAQANAQALLRLARILSRSTVFDRKVACSPQKRHCTELLCAFYPTCPNELWRLFSNVLIEMSRITDSVIDLRHAEIPLSAESITSRPGSSRRAS